MKWRSSTQWLVMVFALVLALAGCRADDLASSSSSSGSDGGDPTNPAGSGDENQLIVYELVEVQGEDGEVETELVEIASGSADSSETLFDELEEIPGIVFIQAPVLRGADNIDLWAVLPGADIERGQRFTVNPFSYIAYRIMQRDGFENLTPARVRTINDSVRDGLMPGVDNFLAELWDLDGIPELAGGDQDLATLYTLALHKMTVAVNHQDEEGDVEVPAVNSRLALAREDLAIDGGSGVFDGRDANGVPGVNLPYNPLRFSPRYETAATSVAFEFGIEAFVDEVSEKETVRFLNADARCDSEFIADYFGLNQGDLSLPTEAVNGYEDLFTEEEDTVFDFHADGRLGILGDEMIDHIAADDLFTCAQTNFDNPETPSLVRFVTDINGNGERDEVVIVGTGDQGRAGTGDRGGIYIASESGDKLAVFGNVDAFGGWRPPEEDDDDDGDDDNGDGDNGNGGTEPDPSDPIACSAGDFKSFTNNVGGDQAVASGDTTGLSASVTSPELAVDGDLTTATGLNIPLSVLLGQASLTVGESPQGVLDDATELAVVVSAPDSILNLTLLDSINVETLLDGERQDNNLNLGLLDLDIAGFFNDENLRFITVDTTDSTFDGMAIHLNAGVLSVDARLQVHDICYR